MSTILITGASTGIGRETALHMAGKGHTVYAGLRNPDGADELKEKIAAENLPVSIVLLDLLKVDTIEAAVAQILKDTGRIDALVNNAGIGAGQAVEMTSLEVVREIFETNYFGTVSVLRAVTPVMRRQRSGRIVNVGSLAGRVPMGCHAHYSASKYALEGLSESLAFEMAEFNVKVAVIEPGCVLTPIWGKVAPPEEVEQPYLKSLQRLGAWFEFNLNRPALPSAVAVAIEHAIEAEQPRFRYPMGADAEEMIAARAKVTDEEWIRVNCLQGDEFHDAMMELVGLDYYR